MSKSKNDNEGAQNKIKSIRCAADKVEDAIGASLDYIYDEISGPNSNGPYYDRLSRRKRELIYERKKVRENMIDTILNLPEVQRATSQLVNIGKEAKIVAKQIPDIKNVFEASTKGLNVAQKFTDTIADSRK